MNPLRSTSALFSRIVTRRQRPDRKKRISLAPLQLEARDCPAANLIANPSVETPSADGPPVAWHADHYGSNNGTFTYLTTGLDGQRSLRVDLTAWKSGDAKWYFDDVPVTPGQTYTFSDLYSSNVATSATVRFKMADGNFKYIGYYPTAAATDGTFTFTFTPPAGAVTATVFHLIRTNGYLITDGFSLTQGTPTADTTAPTVSVTAPTANASVSGTINLTAQASDNVGVAGVKFFVDGNLIGSEDVAAPYQVSLDTTTLTNGIHSITAVARDAAGNSTTSTAVSVTVGNTAPDTSAPTVSVTGPAANASVTGTISLTADAADNIGVVGVKFLVDGTQIGSEATAAPFQASLDTTTLTNGNHSVTAIARDAAGNSTTSAAVLFVVANVSADTTAPTVAVTSPAANASVSGTINLTADASDNVGVVGVKFFVDGNLVGSEVTASPFQVSLDTTTLTNAPHSITAVARDAAGNSTTSAAVSVTVNNVTPDTTAPTVAVTSPAANASVSGTINLTADASDNVGVVGVKFFVDGSQVGSEVTASPFQVSLDTTTLTNAPHSITAVARDAAGNSTTSAAVSVTVNNVTPDTTAPTVSVTGPAANASVSGTINLTATASDNVGVVGVKFFVDGNLIGSEVASSPYQVSLDTTTLSVGTHTVTAVARDAAGNSTTSAGVSFNVAAPADTIAPTVVVNSPGSNVTVSGTVNLSALASDNVGVVGVKFFVDGTTQVGSELTAPPYQAALDTTTLTNGSHTITAVARDAAGNATTSAGVTIAVSNSSGTSATNLIQNPSVETIASNGDPTGWTRGGWGTNTATYSVVPGFDGNNAIRVDVSSYTSGDAKWVFNNVPVAGSTIYNFSDVYQSNVATQIDAAFTLADGSITYAYIAGPAAASTWTPESYQITTPANAVSMTVFHLINSVGFLTTDKYSLTVAPKSNLGGMISLTFDDGDISQYQNAVPVLLQNNLPATFYIITHANEGGASWEEILNPSMEMAANGGPQYWKQMDTGTNTASFVYANTGSNGSHSGQVNVTSYTNGDIGWYFQDVSVTAGTQYTVSHDYNSNVATSDFVRFTLSDGSVTNVSIENLAATNGAWNNQTFTITAPANADAMTLVHEISLVGTLSTDNYSVKEVNPYANPDYMNPAQIQQLAADGFEVGAHTQTHTDLTTESAAAALAQIDGSKADLAALGINAQTLAYPYGSYNSAVEQMVASAGFIGARSVNDGTNTPGTDRYALVHHEVDRTTTVADVQGWINTAQQTGTWLILTFHLIDNSSDFYGTTPQTFQQIINLVKSSNLTPVTVAQGVAALNSASVTA
jgi:peptidoglycan/xylan/chitin deacetylase (PgdA/CDA1 family)